MDVVEYERKGKRAGKDVPDYATRPRRVMIAGGAGFIGSHLARRLRRDGHWVRCVDVSLNEYFEQSEFCDEFMQLDLRELPNCQAAVEGGIEWVFHLAADFGGMGYIAGTSSTILYNSTMLTTNIVEASRQAGVQRLFYSSSACVYNEKVQVDPNNSSLYETMAWPAQPADAYGWEKLNSEVFCLQYQTDFNIEMRIARFHNIYGPFGTWYGGREKSPAAFCRKGAVCSADFEVWGDGQQTRTFCFIDDCVEGVIRLFTSDFGLPVNIGSAELISMQDMARLVLSFDGKQAVPIRNIPGPVGVRGRSSDNTFVQHLLGWAPRIALADGLRTTYEWIKTQIEQQRAAGVDVSRFASSQVFDQEAPEGKKFQAKRSMS